MQRPTQKRLSLPIHTLFVLCQYMGMASVCLGYPGAAPQARLWPGGPLLPRRALMLWAVFFMVVNLFLDRAWLKMLQADMAEKTHASSGYGLHRKTLEALASPVLFILDLIAIYTILSCQQEGAAYLASTRLHTIAMAVGTILWIYGRRMPFIPFGSIWGIRTQNTNQSIQAWGAVHLKAMPGVCLAGLIALTAGVFLPSIPSAACAVLCLFAAFAFMYTRKAQ